MSACWPRTQALVSALASTHTQTYCRQNRLCGTEKAPASAAAEWCPRSPRNPGSCCCCGRRCCWQAAAPPMCFPLSSWALTSALTLPYPMSLRTGARRGRSVQLRALSGASRCLCGDARGRGSQSTDAPPRPPLMGGALSCGVRIELRCAPPPPVPMQGQARWPRVQGLQQCPAKSVAAPTQSCPTSTAPT